MKNIGVNNKIK